MTVLWILLGLFVGLPLLASLLGIFLSPLQRSTRELWVDAPRAKVWAVLSEIEQHPSWRKEIKSVVRVKNRGKQPVWKEILPDGREILIATVKSEAPSLLVRELVSVGTSANARWVYELEEREGKTLLRLSEETQTRLTGMRVMVRLIRRQSQSIEVMLESLRERFA